MPATPPGYFDLSGGDDKCRKPPERRAVALLLSEGLAAGDVREAG
jgi:hypothetical protein